MKPILKKGFQASSIDIGSPHVHKYIMVNHWKVKLRVRLGLTQLQLNHKI